MEAICSSETSVDTQRTTWSYIPEDCTFHNHRCENICYMLLISRCPLLHFFIQRIGSARALVAMSTSRCGQPRKWCTPVQTLTGSSSNTKLQDGVNNIVMNVYTRSVRRISNGTLQSGSGNSFLFGRSVGCKSWLGDRPSWLESSMVFLSSFRQIRGW
jgi:hypothetical protein